MSVDPHELRDLKQMFQTVMSTGNAEISLLFPSTGSAPSERDIDYIKEISNFPVNRLTREINSLRSELKTAHLNLENEVTSPENAIEVSIDSIESILKGDVKQIRSDIDRLTISNPSTGSLHSFREKKQTVKSLMTNVTSLTEFLEIPQVMEQCVNVGAFAEALSLYDYFNRLVKKHSLSGVGIVTTLSGQLATIRDKLVNSIESTLSSQNLKIQEVNNLLLIYRLIFPRASLKSKFLEFRLTYYHSRKRAIVGASVAPAKMLKDYTDLLRVQLSDIVNHFKLLFPSPSSSSTVDVELSRFVLLETKEYLTVFASTLAKLPTDGVFQSVSEVYQMMSFVKVFQLNSAVNAVVHDFLASRVSAACEQMVDAFKTEVRMYNWKPFMSLIPEGGDATSIINLTRHRPVAVLYNDVTTLLNDVRFFPFISLKNSLCVGIDTALRNCFSALMSTVVAGDAHTELELMKDSFCLILVPNAEKNLGTIFAANLRFDLVRSEPRFLTANDVVDDHRRDPVAAVDTPQSSEPAEPHVVDEEHLKEVGPLPALLVDTVGAAAADHHTELNVVNDHSQVVGVNSQEVASDLLLPLDDHVGTATVGEHPEVEDEGDLKEISLGSPK